MSSFFIHLNNFNFPQDDDVDVKKQKTENGHDAENGEDDEEAEEEEDLGDEEEDLEGEGEDELDEEDGGEGEKELTFNNLLDRIINYQLSNK